jgi:hypothetical protein
MKTLSPTETPAFSAASRPNLYPARTVYFDLFDGEASPNELEAARDFLRLQLQQAEQLDSDLPSSMTALESWMHASVDEVGRRYRKYLDERQAGGPRQYFPTRSHALSFIKGVAPTKMVDGAWLYGVLGRWQDPRFGSLIKTYLEELGEGLPTKNHVVLYKKLLASQGIERWDDMADTYYVQGAIQLALAYSAGQFLPEVIGFNLGYEQLPLHLLITAYELKELKVDPYYFTLHITVDNADSGHAKQAVDAIFDAMPRVGDVSDWWRRVQNGYKLNLLGASTNSVIEAFDLEQEVHKIFARKSIIGQFAHSDYRQVEGCTVNEWLADPARAAEFTAALERSGWFVRHQDPSRSRFWKLIQGEKAKMFGVFNAYEQQVIFDWIAGDAADGSSFDGRASRPQIGDGEKRLLHNAAPGVSDAETDFGAEARALEEGLSALPSRQQKMAKLIALMSPALHHSAPGLRATRLFNEIVG